VSSKSGAVQPSTPAPLGTKYVAGDGVERSVEFVRADGPKPNDTSGCCLG
jgi:hypothetical protein